MSVWRITWKVSGADVFRAVLCTAVLLNHTLELDILVKLRFSPFSLFVWRGGFFLLRVISVGCCKLVCKCRCSRLLGKTGQKWRIMCRVGRQICSLTQSETSLPSQSVALMWSQVQAWSQRGFAYRSTTRNWHASCSRLVDPCIHFCFMSGSCHTLTTKL